MAERSFFNNGAELRPHQVESLLSSLPAGICIIRNNLLTWANDALYTMMGYPSGSLPGRDVRIFFPTEKGYDRIKNRLTNLERTGTAMAETRLTRKDGTPVDCRLRSSFLDPDDPDQGVVIVMTDISDIKSLQIQLQQAQKMEAIGVLAGGVSHDFNNILMGIQGHLSLMRIDLTNTEKAAVHVQRIGKLVETAADLTNRLLGFARGGKYQIELLDANQVVEMAMNIFRPTRKSLEIRESYNKTLFPVNGDRSQLEQVCLNLLVNASQAMVDGGELFVSTRNKDIPEDHSYPFEVKPGPYIEIRIQDTGIGMDSEIQRKIFDPFFSTREVGDKKGRGLGLSTVFGIVKNHDGFITVESEKGSGSTFHVCLPAAAKVPVKISEPESSHIDAMLKGSETVLLVDDDEEVIRVGKKFLSRLGYTPLTARNGLEAVEIFRIYHEEISLVVLDLVMPKMDGKQAFSIMKEVREDIKILVATGYTVDDEVEDLLANGCHGFIQKPFSMNDFSIAVRQILDR